MGNKTIIKNEEVLLPLEGANYTSKIYNQLLS